MLSAESILHDLETFAFRAVQPGHGERVAVACARALVECLWLNFRRQYLYVPTGYHADAEVRYQAIWAEFNGRNHAELSIKHRLSLQRVYEIVKHMRQTAMRTRQADLFPLADPAPSKPLTLIVLEDYLPADLQRAGLPEADAKTLADQIARHLCDTYPGIAIKITDAMWQKRQGGGDLFDEAI